MNGGNYHDVVTKLQAFAQHAHGPFARPEWFGLIAKHSGAIPFIHATDRSAMALSVERDVTVALANWYTFTWHPAGKRSEWSDLAQSLRDITARVELMPIADEDGTATELLAAFKNTGWKTSLELCDINHVLNVASRDYASYFAERPGQLRSTIKRKAKKVDCRIFEEFDAVAWSSYETIYDASWKPEEGLPAMLREFAEMEGAAGRLRLAIASSKGEPVAAQFWTVEDGTAYIHKLAHTQAAKPLSAGTVLSAALFEHVIDTDRVNLVDFGTGDDPYKRDWMEDIRPRYRLTAFDPRQPKAWLPMLRHTLRRLASVGTRG